MSKRLKPNLAEEKVIVALGLLKNNWKEVIDFHHAVKNGELDCLHIDVLVLLRSGLALALQVKSDSESAERHTQKYSHIPVIVPQASDAAKEVAHQIQKIILQLYEEVRNSPLPR